MFVLLEVSDDRLSIVESITARIHGISVVAKGNTIAEVEANTAVVVDRIARQAYTADAARRAAEHIIRTVAAKRTAIRAALAASAPPVSITVEYPPIPPNPFLDELAGMLESPPVVAEHCACEGDPDTVVVVDDDGDPEEPTDTVPVDADADARALRAALDAASGAAWFEVK